MKNTKTGGLNRTADRKLIAFNKIIKTGYHTLLKGVCKIGFDSFLQCSKPMTLATAANADKPSILSGFATDAFPDRLYRCLEAFKIPLGSQPDDTTTLRAAIKFKQQRLVVTIKDGFRKTMTP
jgi:hypothetical protein